MHAENYAPVKTAAAKPSVIRNRRAARLRIACPGRLRDWSFSPHARAAVDGRGFDPHEVVRTCQDPEISSTAYDYGAGRFRFVRGHLVVIANPEERRIITVLLRSYQQWNNADARKVVGL